LQFLSPGEVIELELPEESFDCEMFPFFSSVSRGGLSKPSDRLFSICCIAYGLFDRIVCNDVLLKRFLAKTYHREFFCSLACKVIAESPPDQHLLNSCGEGHKDIMLHVLILKCLFNVMCKSTIKSRLPESRVQSRKILKLTSTSA